MKALLVSTFAIAALLFASCSGGNKPERVAKKFLVHLTAGNFKEAGEYGTEDTKKIMELMSSISLEQKPEKQNEIKDVKCTLAEDGNSAVCTYCCNEKGEEGKLNMVKVNGKWLANFKKEMPDMGDLDFNIEGEEEAAQSAVDENAASKQD